MQVRCTHPRSVGGWTYQPWRDNFYPKGLPQSQELGYASRQLSSIEVNGTYYGTPKPGSFQKTGGVRHPMTSCCLKASRYATHRRALAESRASITRIMESGITNSAPSSGPSSGSSWRAQHLMPKTSRPSWHCCRRRQTADGRRLRHVVDVRNEGSLSTDYLSLARRYRVATVFTAADNFPSFADLTSDFV
ncbi:MAG: hypothetical protein JWP47_2406 [Polaromonas sp.]|nr:hypothetical protein [Polaromonas sp.]